MKKIYASMAILAGISVMCSSCVRPSAGYATYTAPRGVVSAGVAWTNANYDANGFPIFGYSYGRPVYGYNANGVAIFTIAALTAMCYVPQWSPASWYRGSFRYPLGIHRVVAPPRYPSGHLPGVRPPAAPLPPAHKPQLPPPAHKHPQPHGMQHHVAPAPQLHRPHQQHQPQHGQHHMLPVSHRQQHSAPAHRLSLSPAALAAPRMVRPAASHAPKASAAAARKLNHGGGMKSIHHGMAAAPKHR